MSDAPHDPRSAASGPDEPTPPSAPRPEEGQLVQPDATELRGRRVLLATIAVYVASLALLLATGTFAFLPKEILLPLLFVPPALSGQFGAFWSDWARLLGLIVLFDAIRGVIYAGVTAFGWPVYMGYAISGDRMLLGGRTGPQLLQDWLYDGVGPLEQLLTLVHASHFAVFFVFGLVFWHWRRPEFGRYGVGLLLVLYVGLVGYALVPTVPPWMADIKFGVHPPLARPIMETYNAVVPNIVTQFDTNPIAAMPSLHCAIPAWMSIVALRHFGLRGLSVAAYACLVFFSVIYGGEHYVVDVLAGIALAIGADAFASRGRGASRPLGTAGQASAAFVALLSTAALAALTSASLRTEWRPTDRFAEHELVGHSPIAPYFLAQNAVDRGEYARTLELLGQLRAPRSFGPPVRLEVEALLGLGEVDAAMALLQRMRPDAARASEHLYWSALARDRKQPLSDVELANVLQRLQSDAPHGGPALAHRLTEAVRGSARP